jgi:hypothetical protein
MSKRVTGGDCAWTSIGIEIPAGFAALAAIFWLLSACGKFPPITLAEAHKLVPALRRQGRLMPRRLGVPALKILQPASTPRRLFSCSRYPPNGVAGVVRNQ